jgi:hypothetical protein
MKEAERLAERLEKRVEYPTQGGNSSVMWFDKDGKEWTADTGQITQLRNPDGPEAAALIRSQAEELERLRRALGAVTKTANLLYANAVGCATNHYGDDIHEHGLPGWLADCAKDIQAARAALGER